MTELIWDGKYDKNGRKTAPLRVALPFQTVEVVNESADDRRKGLLNLEAGQTTDWRNRLIWGDKKYVLPSLLPEFTGRVNLIYIDPPFNTDADFSFTARLPDLPETDEDESMAFTKEASVIEQKAYRDTWGVSGEDRRRGVTATDRYIRWFAETAAFLHELLAENGSLYVHLDWHVGHYAKIVLDELFGTDRFLNEVIWQRTASHNDPQRYGIIHDTILFYTKSENYTWNAPRMQQDEQYIERFFVYAESPRGEVRKLAKGEEPPAGWRRFRLGNFASPHPRPNLTYEYKGYKPPANGWKVSLERMKQLDQEGRLFFPPSKEGRIQTKSYLDEVIGGKAVPDIWTGLLTLQAASGESLGYATQKPEALLERIVCASSNSGDLVLDCFCGSGTTAAVADRLGRRWIACDLGRFAIHTTRKRLLQIPNVRPFVVQNLGKYERQAWQVGEFGEATSAEEAAAKHRQYVDFILRLYGATPLAGLAYIHGMKEGRLVHVGAVDAPVSLSDVKNIAADFRRVAGTGKDAPTANAVDVLGWDFAFELNEIAKQQALAANIQVKFLRIPRDVMDKRAVEQGDIHFFELAALAVKTKTVKREVTLTLTDFVIPPDDVPEDVRRSVRHWEQWIDYWAVDWDNQDDRFHNEWQAYRTRKSPGLPKEVKHTYPAAGTYTVVVKVIDILGNDTTKTIQVKVK